MTHASLMLQLADDGFGNLIPWPRDWRCNVMEFQLSEALCNAWADTYGLQAQIEESEMYTYTIDKMVQDIYRVAGRGVIDEQLNFIAFRVPFWKIEVVRQMLFCYMPVGVGYSIKRLSLIEHFSQWGVTFNTLYGQPREYKNPNK